MVVAAAGALKRQPPLQMLSQEGEGETSWLLPPAFQPPSVPPIRGTDLDRANREACAQWAAPNTLFLTEDGI